MDGAKAGLSRRETCIQLGCDDSKQHRDVEQVIPVGAFICEYRSSDENGSQCADLVNRKLFLFEREEEGEHSKRGEQPDTACVIHHQRRELPWEINRQGMYTRPSAC